jgi:glycosyltransferase involved in cell wall biosynthesis
VTPVPAPAHRRLAIVTPRVWPLVGDGPTHLLRLAEALLAAGHAVTVVTPQCKRSWPRQMRIGPLPLVRLRGRARGGWSTLRWMYQLSRWLQQEDGPSDALVVAGLRHEAYVALGTAANAAPPMVVLAGDDDLDWQKSAPFGSRIAGRCHEARSIVAHSTAAKEALLRAGIADERLTVIERSVPVPPPRSASRRQDARAAVAGANYDLTTTANTQVALAVGRLDAASRFGDLVRAWRIVSARRPEARLWIVGDGPDRERLYRQIGDLDQRFRVLIPGTFDCLDDLMEAADLYLAPAPRPASSIALLEARAAGLPVIAADAVPLPPPVEHEKTGLCYPLGEIVPLADAVTRLLTDVALGVELGGAARQMAQASPTISQEAEQYLALINGLAYENRQSQT